MIFKDHLKGENMVFEKFDSVQLEEMQVHFFMGFLRSPTDSCEKNASLDSPKENRTLITFVIDALLSMIRIIYVVSQ